MNEKRTNLGAARAKELAHFTESRQDKTKSIDMDLLCRMARHLIVNGSFLNNFGLVHGKMGMVIALAMLGRETGETLYEDSAGDLLDEIFEDISENTPINFEDGLCGIGWGILWLLRNGYMEGDPDEVLADVDNKIMERDLRRITDGSFRFGLGGISYYIEERLDECKARKKKAFDQQYLTEWEVGKERCKESLELTLPSEFWSTFDNMDVTKFLNLPLGLENGCAGFIVHALKTNAFL